MADESPALHVHGLTKRYGAVCAVADAGFAVAPGEVVGLLGRNGAGKTTLLECVLGLRAPDEGTIHVCGHDVRARPAEARASVGALLQNATLQDKLTVREALDYFRAFYSRAHPTDALLERFGLTEQARAAFDTLSGGQRQRLFLALAVVHRPRVLVLDEPTTGLDPHARRELQALIRRLRDEGVAVLLSTHDLGDAEQMCDRVGVLERGRLAALGTTGELVRRAGKRHRIVLRTARPLAPTLTPPSAREAVIEIAGTRVVVDCLEVGPTLVHVVGWLGSMGIEVVDVAIERPTLADAFFAVTGTKWEAAND